MAEVLLQLLDNRLCREQCTVKIKSNNCSTCHNRCEVTGQRQELYIASRKVATIVPDEKPVELSNVCTVCTM